MMTNCVRTGPCWLLYHCPGKSQAIPCRVKTAWPKREENQHILFKVTQIFWELSPSPVSQFQNFIFNS